MIRWLIWLGFVVVWTTLLLLPGSTFIPLGLNETPELKMTFFKAGHVLAYVVFALLTGWLRAPARYRLLLLFFIMAHGTVTELIQWYFPVLNRHGEVYDVALDNLGILLGLLAGWKWWSDPK